jgi:ABC-type molybdate transport system substrate-binding protein
MAKIYRLNEATKSVAVYAQIPLATYRQRQQQLIFEATSTRDALSVLQPTFNDRSKIRLDRVSGSGRIASGRIVTERKADDYVRRVLQSQLP